eukprot:3407-Heterococcus_DN1.PRE.2
MAKEAAAAAAAERAAKGLKPLTVAKAAALAAAAAKEAAADNMFSAQGSSSVLTADLLSLQQNGQLEHELYHNDKSGYDAAVLNRNAAQRNGIQPLKSAVLMQQLCAVREYRYAVEPVDDNIYHWRVKMSSIAALAESKLAFTSGCTA